MSAFADFIFGLAADHLRRSKQFEVFVKWFLQNDPERATQVNQVGMWRAIPASLGGVRQGRGALPASQL
jgi:hypothetical protein